MRKAFTLFFLSFLGGTQAQNIEVVNNVLNFAQTDELSSGSETLKIYNPGIYPITVEDVDLFTRFDRLPFVVSDTAFLLMPQDTQQVVVHFEPNHNIAYGMSLVVKTNSGFGHVGVTLTGQGVFSNTYYNGTQNLSDQSLKTALSAKLASNYNSLGYNTARDHMFMTIDNQKTNGQGASVNTLECVYTGTTITGYASRSAAQNGSPQFNTEHTFPQGKFNSNEPMRSDLHHLFPTTNTSNSRRGNDPFGVVSNPSWNVGGSKSGGGSFEPRDVQKGATARAMMYFVLRYQDYQNFFAGQESVLRNWHRTYLPDNVDHARNNAIAALQTARNPFVDYPQLEERIYSFSSSNSRPLVKKLYQSDDTIHLARLAGRYVYDFVLYNEGTANINLNGFALSDTSLRFAQGQPTSILLAPGATETIKINFDSSRDYQASLSFNTDVPGNVNIVVPIRSGTSIGLQEKPLIPRFSVYPNPASHCFSLNFGKVPPTQLWLVDARGRSIELPLHQRIECAHLRKGVYVVKAGFANGYLATRRLVIL